MVLLCLAGRLFDFRRLKMALVMGKQKIAGRIANG
jgi:hypothetical protein